MTVYLILPLFKRFFGGFFYQKIYLIYKKMVNISLFYVLE